MENYYEIKDSKDIFDKWQDLFYKCRSLSAIVQNDMIVKSDELNEWLIYVRTFKIEFDKLLKDTSEFIRKGKISKIEAENKMKELERIYLDRLSEINKND